MSNLYTNSRLYWVGEPPGGRFQGLHPLNHLIGGFIIGLFMCLTLHIWATIGALYAPLLSWVLAGIAVVVILGEIKGKHRSCQIVPEKGIGYIVGLSRCTPLIYSDYPSEPWFMDSLGVIRTPPPITWPLLKPTRTSPASCGTTDKASELILALAVAILANTAGLICSSEFISGMRGWLGSGSFPISRNLEISLLRFCGQMRGTLHTRSAMTSHNVYEDLFVPGKCFPQLANPPIYKLHYLCHVNSQKLFRLHISDQHLTPIVLNPHYTLHTYSQQGLQKINKTNTSSHTTGPVSGLLDSITHQDTQSTASYYSDYYTATGRSHRERNKSTHCPTSPESDNVAIGNDLTYPPLVISKASTSPRNSPKQPWVPCKVPHRAAISLKSLTTLSTRIVFLARYLTP